MTPVSKLQVSNRDNRGYYMLIRFRVQGLKNTKAYQVGTLNPKSTAQVSGGD